MTRHPVVAAGDGLSTEGKRTGIVAYVEPHSRDRVVADQRLHNRAGSVNRAQGTVARAAGGAE